MIRPEYLEALRDLGCSQQESRFLYLAATHSGYFTLGQFLGTQLAHCPPIR